MLAGALPQTPLGSLQRSPDPLAGFKVDALHLEGNGGSTRGGEEGKEGERGMEKEGEWEQHLGCWGIDAPMLSTVHQWKDVHFTGMPKLA